MSTAGTARPSAATRLAAVGLLVVVAAASALLASGASLLGWDVWEDERVNPGARPKVEPVPAREARPPANLPVRLIELVPREVGGFRHERWEDAGGVARTFRAARGIRVEFRGAGGERVVHYLLAYPSAGQALMWAQRYVGAYQANGYVPVARGSSGDGTAWRLEGQVEAVVWSQGPLLGVVEGPPSAASALFAGLPY